jgi:hypothetical protein
VQIKNLIKRQLKRNTMSEIDEATPKGEALVKYCAICGVEFSETAVTNNFFKCKGCDNIIQVRVQFGE